MDSAQLIATAPELLEALQSYVDYDGEPEGERYEEIRLAARDAIAKAEGSFPAA